MEIREEGLEVEGESSVGWVKSVALDLAEGRERRVESWSAIVDVWWSLLLWWGRYSSDMSGNRYT